MGAGWGFAPGCRVDPHSPYWVLDDDGRTPVRVDQATRYAWVAAHPPTDPPVRVGYYEGAGGVSVSTVFIGLDTGPGEPKLWETLVYFGEGDDGGPFEQRWPSYDTASRAHEFLVELVSDPAALASIVEQRRQLRAQWVADGADP